MGFVDWSESKFCPLPFDYFSRSLLGKSLCSVGYQLDLVPSSCCYQSFQVSPRKLLTAFLHTQHFVAYSIVSKKSSD